MINQENTSGARGTAAAQEQPRTDEDTSPPDKIRGESAAQGQKGQEGQPGLHDSDRAEWSPGSGGEEK